MSSPSWEVSCTGWSRGNYSAAPTCGFTLSPYSAWIPYTGKVKLFFLRKSPATHVGARTHIIMLISATGISPGSACSRLKAALDESYITSYSEQKQERKRTLHGVWNGGPIPLCRPLSCTKTPGSIHMRLNYKNLAGLCPENSTSQNTIKSDSENSP